MDITELIEAVEKSNMEQEAQAEIIDILKDTDEYKQAENFKMFDFAGCFDSDTADLAMEIHALSWKVWELSQKLAKMPANEEFDRIHRERMEFIEHLERKVAELKSIVED